MRDVVHGTDTLAGLKDAQLQELVARIQETISLEARPEPSLIPAKMPHHQLARWIERIDRTVAVEIFTLNYDTLLERGLEDERVARFDGFVGSHRPFSPQPASLASHSRPAAAGRASGRSMDR